MVEYRTKVCHVTGAEYEPPTAHRLEPRPRPVPEVEPEVARIRLPNFPALYAYRVQRAVIEYASHWFGPGVAVFDRYGWSWQRRTPVRQPLASPSEPVPAQQTTPKKRRRGRPRKSD